MNNAKLWILAEQFEGEILKVSYELLGRAKDLSKKKNCQVAAVIFGANLGDAELQKLIDRGADFVLAIEAPELKHFDNEAYSRCMLGMIDKYEPEIIIAAATSTGRTLMPYVAMTAHTGLTADCTVLDIDEEGKLLQTRPAIGGNIMATIRTQGFMPQMATVRPHSSKPAAPVEGRVGEIVRVDGNDFDLSSNIKRKELVLSSEELQLQEADKVVIVGRGIKRAENIKLIRELCDLLGAALGATRDVVDRGWLSYPHQVGLSGKTINPKLCVSIGVSGAIQQLAGMQTAENIIAINKDPEAQIFKVADIGMVGDLFEIVPVLIAKLKNGESL
ncbi:MAG: electron transfer flavoprotein subunit alpha/FixB family protein [Kiritimatiellae bacterium]|jgi:electron transfer flavoprotein alpha subunit|nr:electron transfer flavoprotein subunit alpha/FixB family protein [Kiritimatiellia bacterium]